MSLNCIGYPSIKLCATLGTSKEDTHARSRNIMAVHPMHGTNIFANVCKSHNHAATYCAGTTLTVKTILFADMSTSTVSDDMKDAEV